MMALKHFVSYLCGSDRADLSHLMLWAMICSYMCNPPLNSFVIIYKDSAWCPSERRWKMLTTELMTKSCSQPKDTAQDRAEKGHGGAFPPAQPENASPPADPRSRMLELEDC